MCPLYPKDIQLGTCPPLTAQPLPGGCLPGPAVASHGLVVKRQLFATVHGPQGSGTGEESRLRHLLNTHVLPGPFLPGMHMSHDPFLSAMPRLF